MTLGESLAESISTFPQNFSLLIIYDGVHVYPTISRAYRNFDFSFMLACGVVPGGSLSVAF